MNSAGSSSVGHNATRGAGGTVNSLSAVQNGSEDLREDHQRVPALPDAPLAQTPQGPHEVSSDDRREQLKLWSELLREALRANNRYQDTSQDLAQEVEESLARLYDLEYLSRSLGEEMRQPRNVRITAEGDFSLHQINQSWMKYFHDVELPHSKDAEIYRRYQMHTHEIPWSKDELQALRSEVHMEVAKLSALEAAKHRVRVDELREWTRSEEADLVDWAKVAGNQLLMCHGAEGCRLRWINHEHPSLSKSGWTKTETIRLMEVVGRHGERDWAAIAAEMGTSRTPAACLSHYRKQKTDKKEWSKQEDADLKDGVVIFGTNWQSLARYVGRNSDQCYNRWLKSLKSEIKRNRWTAEEDQSLSRAVEYVKRMDGGASVSWQRVALRVKGRTDAQCRERWSNKLDPKLKKDKDPWTADEDTDILRLYQEVGPKWSAIARSMGGTRTDNAILRRYSELQRKDQDPEGSPLAEEQTGESKGQKRASKGNARDKPIEKKRKAAITPSTAKKKRAKKGEPTEVAEKASVLNPDGERRSGQGADRPTTEASEAEAATKPDNGPAGSKSRPTRSSTSTRRRRPAD